MRSIGGTVRDDLPFGCAAGIIDVHTHAIDPDLPALAGYRNGSPQLVIERTDDVTARILVHGKPYRTVDDRCWSPARRIADMDRAGVAAQVLSPIPVTFRYDAPPAAAEELARAQNDFFARIIEWHPDRFAALAAVPLQDPDRAIAELRRVMRLPGFIGAEVGGRIAGTELSDPTLDEFFTVASELDALVLVHPVDHDVCPRIAGLGIGFGLGMPVETAVAAAGLLTSGAMRRRPAVRYCLAHGGGALPAVMGRLDKGAALIGAFPDSQDLPSRLARGMLCDSLTYDRSALMHAVTVFGPDHVVFGSDYPFPAMPEHPDAVLAGLPGDLRDAIARANFYANTQVSQAAAPSLTSFKDRW
jgi:aminocarboxymuconate-semialdehyde decarboxylase